MKKTLRHVPSFKGIRWTRTPNFWIRVDTISFVLGIFWDKNNVVVHGTKCKVHVSCSWETAEATFNITCKFLWIRAILQCPTQVENMAAFNDDPSTPNPCRYLSCTSVCTKLIILPRYCQGICDVQWCKVQCVWQNFELSRCTWQTTVWFKCTLGSL